MYDEIDKDALIAHLTRALQLEYDGYEALAVDVSEGTLFCPHCRTATAMPGDALAHRRDCPHRIVDEALADGRRYLMGCHH